MSIEIDYKTLMYNFTLIAGSETKIDRLLMKSFSLIGNTLLLSRIYYFIYHEELHEFSNLYEWVRGKAPSALNSIQSISCKDVDWLYQGLITRNLIRYDNVNEITDSEVKNMLADQQIKSILAVPVYVHGKFKGFVGLDQRDRLRSWNDFDEYLLYTLAIMISQSAKERLLEEALSREHEQLLAMVDNIGGFSYTIDIANYKIVYANKELKSLCNRNLEGEICYKVLQGKNQPCEFCTNKYLINSEGPYSWEYHNQELQRDFYLVDRLIRLPDGKQLRFEVGFDITKQKQSEKALHTEKELLRVTLLSIGDGVITTDNKGKITMLNKAAVKLTGWQYSDAIDKSLSEVYKILNRDSYQPCENSVERALKLKQFVKANSYNILISKDRSQRFISESAAPIRDNQEQIIGSVLVFRDETDSLKKEDRIKYLSTRDGLTGLYNRGYFEQIILQNDLPENYPISLIVGDVNGLKLTNDVFGHEKGDLLLKSIASIINETCADKGWVARWGGDEFVVLLLHTSSRQAHDMCKIIKEKCNNPEQHIWSYSISFGYSTKQNVDEDIMAAFKHAEDYMYKSKLQEGKILRNTVISSMQKKLYQKTFETEDHIMEIVATSCRIGSFLNLQSSKMKQLRLLAEYHDIGKISIDRSILLKESKLTKEEWNKLKRHPEVAYRIAKAVSELSIIAEELLCLRERWDGRGYPQGIEKQKIPLLSRIVAVSDAYHSMLSTRPYRSALSTAKVFKELRNNSGKQFDPEIVWVLLNKVLI